VAHRRLGWLLALIRRDGPAKTGEKNQRLQCSRARSSQAAKRSSDPKCRNHHESVLIIRIKTASILGLRTAIDNPLDVAAKRRLLATNQKNGACV
jgi:hypothetical protein